MAVPIISPATTSAVVPLRRTKLRLAMVNRIRFCIASRMMKPETSSTTVTMPYANGRTVSAANPANMNRITLTR